MLVLSRKQEQRIQIGDDVVVTILKVKGHSVRIGIEAPQEMHIKRGELSDDVVGTVAARSAEEQTTPAAQSEPHPTRRRDRVLAKRRSPAFTRRRIVNDADDGPLRRFVQQRHPRDQRSALNPAPRGDKACGDKPSGDKPSGDTPNRIGPLRREPSCETIVDRSRIDLHLDPYMQAPALRHRHDSRFCGTDESPVVRALRWRA